MTHVNYLPLIGSALFALAESADAPGLGLTATAAGFLAMLATVALILLTRRVADLEDRRDDCEENRNLIADRQ